MQSNQGKKISDLGKMQNRNKTVLRSLRLSKSLDESMQHEALNRSVSVNSFAASILDKYFEWEILSEKFRFISLPNEMLASLVEALDDEKLVQLGKAAGSVIPREVMLFWFKTVDLETFISYLSFHSKYLRTADYKIVRDGENVIVTAHHQLSDKWSVWLKSYLIEAVRVNLGVVPKAQVSTKTVRVEFTTQ
jgi:hypothetical protein